MPGHDGILGNERADELAENGADTTFAETETVLSLSYRVVMREIGNWMERKHIECWPSGKHSNHSKGLNKAVLLNCLT